MYQSSDPTINPQQSNKKRNSSLTIPSLSTPVTATSNSSREVFVEPTNSYPSFMHSAWLLIQRESASHRDRARLIYQFAWPRAVQLASLLRRVTVYWLVRRARKATRDIYATSAAFKFLLWHSLPLLSALLWDFRVWAGCDEFEMLAAMCLGWMDGRCWRYVRVVLMIARFFLRIVEYTDKRIKEVRDFLLNPTPIIGNRMKTFGFQVRIIRRSGWYFIRQCKSSLNLERVMSWQECFLNCEETEWGIDIHRENWFHNLQND